MWLLTETGLVHSGRIIAVRPPAFREARTIKIVYEGGTPEGVEALRSDVMDFFGIGEEDLRERAKNLGWAHSLDEADLDKMNAPLEEVATLRAELAEAEKAANVTQ